MIRIFSVRYFDYIRTQSFAYTFHTWHDSMDRSTFTTTGFCPSRIQLISRLISTLMPHISFVNFVGNLLLPLCGIVCCCCFFCVFWWKKFPIPSFLLFLSLCESMNYAQYRVIQSDWISYSIVFVCVCMCVVCFHAYLFLGSPLPLKFSTKFM